jgi:TRAP-type C4-dicarboxylate transport system permease small subunit
VPESEGRGAAARIEAALLAATRGLTMVAAAATAAIFAVVFAAVVMRYAVGAPFAFTEELSGLLLAMSVFLMLPLTVAANLNIRITLVTERLRGTAARLAWVFGELILLAFFAVFAWEAWKFFGLALRFKEKSEQAQLVLAPWKLAAAALFLLCALIALWRALRPPPTSEGAPPP